MELVDKVVSVFEGNLAIDADIFDKKFFDLGFNSVKKFNVVCEDKDFLRGFE